MKNGNEKRKTCYMLIGFFIMVIGMLIVSACLVSDGLSVGATSLGNTYKETLAKEKNEIYQKFYQVSFQKSEKKHHVSNNVTIQVDQVREEASLEVLRVSDIEYIITEDNIERWTAVWGYGIYTIDLKLSEFIVDDERQFVLVRVPRPQLSTTSLDYKHRNYLFERGIFKGNGNISEGVDAAREDLKEACNKLRSKLSTTQIYNESAEKSAKELITSLVRSFNPELPELVVEVEFME